MADNSYPLAPTATIKCLQGKFSGRKDTTCAVKQRTTRNCSSRAAQSAQGQRSMNLYLNSNQHIQRKIIPFVEMANDAGGPTILC